MTQVSVGWICVWVVVIAATILPGNSVYGGEFPPVTTKDMSISYYPNASTAFRIDFSVNFVHTGVYMLWNYPPIRELTPSGVFVQRGVPIPAYQAAPITNAYYFESTSFNNLSIDVPPTPRRLDAQFLNYVEENDEREEESDDLGELENEWVERDDVQATLAAAAYVLHANYSFPALGPNSDPIFVSDGGFKFSTLISDWPFLDMNNLLQQRVHASIVGGVLDTSQLNDPVAKIIIRETSGEHAWVISLQRECRINNTANPVQPVNLTFSIPHEEELIVSWVFPASNSIYYDPDVQSLIGGGSDGSDGDGKSGDGNSNAVAIAVGVVVPVACIIVCCVIIVVIVLSVLGITARQRRQRALSDAVANSSEV